jgi:protein-L-isoaspartate(D-aspartate) O-methyltransferase
VWVKRLAKLISFRQYQQTVPSDPLAVTLLNKDPFRDARITMVEKQLRRRGLTDHRVLAAMERVERHRFVPSEHRRLAYEDCALPIGLAQSISQPYMVAAMTQALEVTSTGRVLEVGTGSGYQTAVLAELVARVFTIERLASLSYEAQAVLESLNYSTVEFKIGDGSKGWPAEAPFDGIMVTAAATDVPAALLDQLADGACLVVPVGGPPDQDLLQIRRDGESFEERFITRCRFVPLIENEEE